MELERKLLEHEPTAVPAELLVSFPEKSELVFAALDYLYDLKKMPISKIKADTIRQARGFLEDKRPEKRKGDRAGLGEMMAAWMQVRGIDKHNDPNDSLIPADMADDGETERFVSNLSHKLKQQLDTQYKEALERAESKTVSLEELLRDTQEALGQHEIENEALRRKLHEMEPVYKDALAQHGKMRTQNETLKAALDKSQENYEKLGETLKTQFEGQYREIIEAKDAQIADLQKQVEDLKEQVKATRNSLMEINEEQRGVFIVDKDHAKTKIADLEERLSKALESQMELHRQVNRLKNEKAAVQSELSNVRESQEQEKDIMEMVSAILAKQAWGNT